MKVEAETKVLLVFKADNKDSSMGCYYPEDDWTLEVTSDNLPELELKVTEELVKTGIVAEYPRLYTAEYLIYGDKQFCLHKVSDLDARTFLWKIEHQSDYYRKLKELKAEAKKLEDAIIRKKSDEERLKELEDEVTEIRKRIG